jgi:DNA-binding LacI/PurR family transcriptional regulator
MPKRATTIEDVARAAGVSRTTAIFALNRSERIKLAAATRQRVIDTAERLGYRRNGLASALSRGKTGTIGVIARLPSAEGSQAPGIYISSAVLGIMQAATRAGLRTTLLPTSTEHPLSVDEAVDQRVDGLILVSLADGEDDALARGIYASGFPCVSTGSGYAERRILADNYGGTVAAMEHLLSLGHRRIRYLGARAGSLSSSQRFEAVRDTLARHAVPCDVDRLAVHTEEMLSLLALTAAERPTAFLCFNDWMASEAVRLAFRAGLRVPEELSVIGFDNSVVAETCHPRLTTVHASMQEQAEAALSVLHALWRGEEPTLPPPLPTRLVVRESAAPPPV